VIWRSSKDTLARWGLLISTFILAAVLIVASWANYNSARNAMTTLYRGQAVNLSGALRSIFHHRNHDGIAAEMDSVLAAQESEGLRFIGLVNDLGEVVRSSGKPTDVPFEEIRDNRREGQFRLVKLESLVRTYMFRPPPGGKPGRERFADSRNDRPRPGGQRPTSGGDSTQRGNDFGAEGDRSEDRKLAEGNLLVNTGLVIEFEPVIASDLLDRATRLRAFGLAAALVLMLAAAIFWRISRRYEQTMKRLEHERRLSLLGEMSAVMAHEIRNPLASLKGHAQLLSERLPDNSGDRSKADRVVYEATRLEALTSDLLDFVKTGSPDLKSVNPTQLIEVAIQEVGGDQFELDAISSPESWQLDEQRLRQVMTNLLRNAVQATPAGARKPIIRVTKDQNGLVISIRDFGAGFPPRETNRIFDPFFTTRTTGTGLGLSVSRRIVELHGGRITARNHDEGGAIFEIVLPAQRG